MMTRLGILAAGALGGGLAHWAGLPSGWLLGAMLSVALVSMMGARTSLPKRFLPVIQTVLGLAVGLRTEMEFHGPEALLISVSGLFLCLATQIPLSQYLLRRLGWSQQEAMLAASPGALSVMAALATRLDNPLRVILSQTVRVILLVSTVSVAIMLDLVPEGPGHPPDVPLSWAATAALLLAAWLLGELGSRLRLPASHILAGVAVGAGYALWSGRSMVPVDGLLPTSMILLGTLVGSRLRPLPWREMGYLLMIGALLSLSSSVMALLWSAGVSWWLDIPLFQVWLAYAPGAVEAMIYLAMVTGLEPSWVIFHHVLRIVVLSAGAGWLMRQAGSGLRTG